HAGRARHVELLGDLGERADAHVLERRQLDLLYFLWGFFGSRGRGAGSAGLFAGRSIILHSSSNPSPVSAETGSTDVSKTDSSCLIARIRSPRASLSILVATIPQRATVWRSQFHASMSAG